MLPNREQCVLDELLFFFRLTPDKTIPRQKTRLRL